MILNKYLFDNILIVVSKANLYNTLLFLTVATPLCILRENDKNILSKPLTKSLN